MGTFPVSRVVKYVTSCSVYSEPLQTLLQTRTYPPPPRRPLQGLLQVESFQSGSEHFGEDPAGDSGLAATGAGGSESSFVLCPGETLPRDN